MLNFVGWDNGDAITPDPLRIVTTVNFNTSVFVAIAGFVISLLPLMSSLPVMTSSTLMSVCSCAVNLK
jgi:hypothetical protein